MLVDLNVKNAKPKEKPYKLTDGQGMHLLISPNGSKLWRFAYRFLGKQKLLSLGKYPDVGLLAARKRLAEVRELLSNGVDPSENRRATKAAIYQSQANSFELLGREFVQQKGRVWSVSNCNKIARMLERDVYPFIGRRPVSELTAPQILEVLRRMETRGAVYSAHRVRSTISQVMRYAISTGRAERDPCPDLIGALPHAKSGNFAAITDPVGVGELLRALDAFKGTFSVQCALKLAPLFFVRPGELRQAQWAHFDFERAEWRYTTPKTKTAHIVPLAAQAILILKELNHLTGAREYVFPGRDPKRPMSDAAINAALRRLGYDTKTEITGHGFRAMARTILHEELGFEPAIIEHQLAHRVSDSLGTAYNRTTFLPQRKIMMQRWADYLDELKLNKGH